ncbi:MAG: PilZ domain-containing protein [Desulfobacteraceae bacterium]|nr:PilZ domain-containing protein [Desulfobacteraceae bacterium]
MPIKIKSNIKSLMSKKNINTGQLREKTSLPHIVILNACSDKIEFIGLNILNKIATAMNVSIKELFDEIDPKQKKMTPKSIMTGDTNISSITSQLINLIMKMSTTDKDKLMRTYNELNKSSSMRSDVTNVTTNLVDLIMTMSLEGRCQLLGDFISYSGTTKRKYSRQDFCRPADFTAKGTLFHGNTKNISHGGVFIEIKNAKNNFSLGDPVKMNLEHPQTSQHFNITGKIVRIAKAGIGIHFDRPL